MSEHSNNNNSSEDDNDDDDTRLQYEDDDVDDVYDDDDDDDGDLDQTIDEDDQEVQQYYNTSIGDIGRNLLNGFNFNLLSNYFNITNNNNNNNNNNNDDDHMEEIEPTPLLEQVSLDDEMIDYVSESDEIKTRIQSLATFDPFTHLHSTDTMSAQCWIELENYIKVIAFTGSAHPFTSMLSPLKEYMTGGAGSFSAMKASQRDSTCGYVFKDNDWAFQCKRCQKDETSILCSKCFDEGKHVGHEIKRIRVSSNGCCDCGDEDSWAKDGFCDAHTERTEPDDVILRPLASLGPDHVARCERLLGILLDMILQPLANIKLTPEDSDVLSNRSLYFFHPGHPFEFLLDDDQYGILMFNDDVTSFGEVMSVLLETLTPRSQAMCRDYAHYAHNNGRCIIYVGSHQQCQVVVSMIRKQTNLKLTITKRFKVLPFASLISILNLFEYLTQLVSFKRIFCNLMMRLNRHYLHTEPNILDPKGCRLAQLVSNIQKLHHSRQVQLINWVTSLTFDRSCKFDFAAVFVSNYPAMFDSLLNGAYDGSNSIISLSIQIFTRPQIAMYVMEHYKALDIFLDYIKSATPKYLIVDNEPLTYQSELGSMSKLEQFYVAIKDLTMILSHQPIFRDLMCTNPSKIVPLLQFAALLHFSCPNIRSELVFSELRTSYFSHGHLLMMNHCNVTFKILKTLVPEPPNVATAGDELAISNTIAVLCKASTLIKQQMVGVSFNLPIHRCLSLILSLVILHFDQFSFQDMAASFLQNQDLVEHSLYGPANIDNLIAESKSRLWLKNGDPIELQVHSYQSHPYLKYIYIYDLYLKQMSCASLKADHFITTYFSHFKRLDTLFQSNTALNNYQTGVLVYFYQFLMVLITERSLIGKQTTRDVIKYDIIHHLIVKNRTYTKLNTLLNTELRFVNFDANDVDSVLKEVAIYVQPNTLSSHGRYSLKPEYYTYYNKYYYGYTYRYRERAEEVVSTLPQQHRNNNVRRVAVNTLAPLRQDFDAIGQLLLSPQLYKRIYFSLLHCTVQLVDPVPLDEYDTQQRVIFRSDTVDNILHLMMLALDTHPTEHDTIKKMCISRQHDRVDSASQYQTIVDLLDLVLTTSSMKFFHPTVALLLQSLKEPTLENGHECDAFEMETMQDKEDRKRRMLEAKRKAMESIAKEQLRFSNLLEDEHMDSDEDMTLDGSHSAHEVHDVKGECIICRDENYLNDLNNPIGYFCLIQNIGIAHVLNDRSSIDPSNGVVDQQDFASSIKLDVSKSETIAQICGHTVHYQCYIKMERFNHNTHRLCPLCHFFSNTLLPPAPVGLTVLQHLHTSNHHQHDDQPSGHTAMYLADGFAGSKLLECFEAFGKVVQSKLPSPDTKISMLLASTINNLEFISRNNQWNLQQTVDEKTGQMLRHLSNVLYVYHKVLNLRSGNWSEKEPAGSLCLERMVHQVYVDLSVTGRPQLTLQNYLELTAQQFEQALTSPTSEVPRGNDRLFYQLCVDLRKLVLLDSVLMGSTSTPLPSMELSPKYLVQLIAYINGNVHRTRHQIFLEQPLQEHLISKDVVERQPPQFKLVTLPNTFFHLSKRTFVCSTCNLTKNNSDQALCLLCGRAICIGSCCKRNGANEINWHSKTCCGDIGLYLLMELSIVAIVFDHACFGFLGSPFLDSHGEDDPGLKRGIPLFLSKDRYNLLSEMILKNNAVKYIKASPHYIEFIGTNAAAEQL
ncbi:hypothetical protein SAMD00019534_090970 [Acytostelium subglobosum LB1]|uniref:hypothetical protein n=1 Tax=Acytostelium subglobosum LB1 TaxID=1410327 RepID=UPI000644F4AA|nr:hypothetical protein SAMD00019534_090970 [Acytostelium subglobosum LB1]GAM25922.1 hypothetical protein SAMD00019534_090970 [Acytostelium subglobosum LB1]|eukprot:XP_012750965.1 hypothetical protein SAMD00019534_090970 [Acytostelium subglobosum LB1]